MDTSAIHDLQARPKSSYRKSGKKPMADGISLGILGQLAVPQSTAGGFNPFEKYARQIGSFP